MQRGGAKVARGELRRTKRKVRAPGSVHQRMLVEHAESAACRRGRAGGKGDTWERHVLGTCLA